MKHLAPLDMNRNEIRNSVVQNLAAAPASPITGLTYFDTTLGAEFTFNGVTWISKDASKVADGYIPLSKLAVNPLARANHTGTQLANTISDLASTVQGYSLSLFAAPLTNIAMSGKGFTGMADPVNAQDAATKNYVDLSVQSSAAGIDSKPSCRVIAVSNITLSGTQTIDGVTVAASDRVLCKGQTTATQNGVYVVAAGAWARSTDADQSSELTPGAFWYVEEGSTYAKTQWRIENAGTITIGTTNITINQFGAAALYTASLGVQLVGSDFRANFGAGLTLSGNQLVVDTAVMNRKASATIGDGAATSITFTHNLNTQDVVTQVREVSTNNVIGCDIQNNGVNTVVLGFGSVAPAANSLRVTCTG